MPLKITYWTGVAPENENVAGQAISSESLAITGVSAQSGLTPTNATIVSIYSTEAAHFEYSSANPTAAAASSPYVGANERLWLDALPGYKIAGITG